MNIEPILVDGVWQRPRSPAGFFRSLNPATRKPLQPLYPVSGFPDIELALSAARKAVTELKFFPPDRIAKFLELFADSIEARSHALVSIASRETALSEEPRLRSVELPRTISQLCQAAAACRDRSWRRATIDNRNNIRSMLGPLGGPVVIFGPNNFPFAFNPIGGGDFAAAIAAANPVIAKANPGHPGTTKILADAAFEALKRSGLPKKLIQLLYHIQPEDGCRLVSHPVVGAVAFTGSRVAGLGLKHAADMAGKPIYLEMSSINPVFILSGALKERRKQIAKELFNSCAMASGQFCTKPGLVILPQDDSAEAFLKDLKGYFQAASLGFLLGQKVVEGIKIAIKKMKRCGAKVVTGGREEVGQPGYCFSNTIVRVSGDDFLKNPLALQTEAFGAVALLVFANNPSQMDEIARALEGSLTGTIYSHTKNKDDRLYVRIESILRHKVGRLLNDKMPTGVAVSPAMNHGGPYPATGHPGFTAVGIPASLLRFTALHCYDNVRQSRLPLELQDKNPTGTMWRFIDGQWTQADI